jgi:hypothetical protein
MLVRFVALCRRAAGALVSLFCDSDKFRSPTRCFFFLYSSLFCYTS